jgi:8-oxo-dGTP diphosphatase
MSYVYEYPRPCVTVDIVLFRKVSKATEVLLIERGHPPFQGSWAFPGGFIEMDEDLETAALRELREETKLSGIALRQFKTYGAVHRDPRHRTITVAYVALIPEGVECNPVAGDDASHVAWFGLHSLPLLAFDHSQILQDVLDSKQFFA